ncbi:anti-sigma factor domain-containing protein [Planococcus sp. NCCP-2050]|uniref:anti-sigma factor n=1 Tax=Planococcus sp. NCCP-2050 TaxID=2944679 RepID=UPI002041115B|nr:anti-sigma factor [Planococcus sp. NCCP-2050]GKW45810.1 hypothetical protein NCCP2050_15020 [Planococcus sp. NCCP-2050]
MAKLNCDHVIDYLNGTLSKEEQLEFEQHLKTCADCQEIIEMTGDLPYLADPVDPPAGMKARILSTVFEEEEQEKSEEVRRETTPLITQKTVKKKNRWPVLIAAALFVSLLGNGYALLKLSEQPDFQSIDLQPNEVFGGTAKAAIIREEESLELVVQAEQLEALEGEQVYQIWLLKEGKPIPAGAFTPSANGEGNAYYSLEGNTEDWDTIAITLEPQAGNASPQGEIVLSSEI